MFGLDLVSGLLRVCGGGGGQGKAEEARKLEGGKERVKEKFRRNLEDCAAPQPGVVEVLRLKKEGALKGPGRSRLVCLTGTAGTNKIYSYSSSPAATPRP